MWLFTSIGFYSAVQKPGDDFLTVRARVGKDLDNLRQRYMPDLGATVAGGGTDYPFRATISHAAFAAGLAELAKDIDYTNFKSEVGRQMGYERAHVYGDVWHSLLKLEDENERAG